MLIVERLDEKSKCVSCTSVLVFEKISQRPYTDPCMQTHVTPIMAVQQRFYDFS